MSTTAAARYRVPAGLSHRNRRNIHAHLPSLRLFPRKIDWTRAGSALLALLVAATLTLICQGHDRGSYHQGPHLAFLDIFGYHHAPAAQATPPGDGFEPVSFDSLYTLDVSGSMDMASMDMAGMDMSQGDMHSMHMVNLAAYSHAAWQLSPTTISPSSVPDATNPGGANIASAVTSSTSEAGGLSMLSFLLLVFVLRRDPIFAPLEPATTTRSKSQVIALAEPPPPRPA
ncbi:MAG: hypothetical protein ABJA50_09035 [Chloroflexota bacterium]